MGVEDILAAADAATVPAGPENAANRPAAGEIPDPAAENSAPTDGSAPAAGRQPPAVVLLLHRGLSRKPADLGRAKSPAAMKCRRRRWVWAGK